MSSHVLVTITAEDVHRHREVLAQWVTANGLDPRSVAERPGLTIEQAGERMMLCYQELQRDDQGRSLVDPADRREAWMIKRAVPLRVPLPALDLASDYSES